MNLLMVILLSIFIAIMAVVGFMAWRNRIMLKLGLRNIPRRRAQTILIVVGSMLSAVIIAAAFGTGDTISFSIRDATIQGLGNIDEIVTSARGGGGFQAGGLPYFPRSRFDELQRDLAGFDAIDGMAPSIGGRAPALNLRTSLTDGQTEIVAVDPDFMQGFGEFQSVSGGDFSLNSLSENGVAVNAEAMEEMELRTGDTVRLFLEGQEIDFQVEGVVEDGGFAGANPTVLMPLDRGQALFDRPGQINSIAVSNRGGAVSGAEASEEVATRLRVLFADRGVAEELRVLLNRQEVLSLLEQREETLTGNIQGDIATLRQELQLPQVSDGLIRVLADSAVRGQVLDILGEGGLAQLEGQADTLFGNLSEMDVTEIKRTLLELADAAGSGVTTFFIVLGLFSVMVGVLLIFLIFVMLAAARRTEMGMARALGAKRGHLVQMFMFEGTTYDLVAAALGTTIGLGVGLLLMAFANQIVAGSSEDFRFLYRIEPRSAVVAYCLGMIITFATVVVSAYRVSRMNIVEAVRGLPEVMKPVDEEAISLRLSQLGWSLIRPLVFLARFFIRLAGSQFAGALRSLGAFALWILLVPWFVDIAAALVKFAWPYVLRGWLTLLFGAYITYLGVGPWNQTASFTIGVSLMIVGLGMMLRMAATRWEGITPAIGLLTAVGGAVTLGHGIVASNALSSLIGAGLLLAGLIMTAASQFRKGAMPPDFVDRQAFTFIGLIMLGWWILPFDTLEPVIGDLNGGIEMFFVSGVSVVAAAVWTVMYNADLLLKATGFVSSGIGKIRPVVVIAVAYPMSAKFRTGLTLAMFALVIFTLIVMSILNNAFGNTLSDADEVTGGWDIEATVAPNSPIEDIRGAIEAEPGLNPSDFAAIGGFIVAPVVARQGNAESQRWEGSSVQAVDDGFLNATEYDFQIIADGYGPARQDVWQALKDNPNLAVVSYATAPSQDGGGFGDQGPDFQLEGMTVEDVTMSPIDIEVLEPQSDTMVPYTVIGVLRAVADNSGNILISKESVDAAFPFPVPLTTYRFRAAEGVDVKETSRALESSFLENGAETSVLKEVIDQAVSVNRGFNNLMTGFMGMGLVVGIAALGVISLRAVVERRQHIGVLRAIGYRQGMIQLSFLFESSFVALLGVIIGVALGAIISYNLVQSIANDIPGLQFSMPWLQISVIIVITYLFSMLTTYLPARQAGNVHPAEALRYE